jgi:hypothetical protein
LRTSLRRLSTFKIARGQIGDSRLSGDCRERRKLRKNIRGL